MTSAVTKQPTCIEKGETTYTSETFENEAFAVQSKTVADIDMTDHILVIDEAIPATCMATGLTEGSHCSYCGETLVPQEIVEKVPHQYVTDEAIPATCTTTGLTEGSHCSYCGEIFIPQEIVEMIPHQYIVDDATSATCEHPGHSSSIYCETCGTVFLEPIVIPALGHDWGEPKYNWAEDNSTITASCVCARNPEHVNIETVQVIAEIIKQPTCTEKGETTYISTEFENEEFTVQGKTIMNIDALGHDWGEISYTWAEDNSSVTATRVCHRNEEHMETETVTVISEVTKQPACLEKGETTYTSEEFKNEAFAVQSRTVANIDMTGHTPVTDGAIPATCIATGLTEGSHCEVCGEIIVPQEVVEKISHQYVVDEKVSATCEHTGLTSGIHCDSCGTVFLAQTEIPALGHDWGEEVTYTWSDDNRMLTASRVCTHDATHIDSETVGVSFIATESPTDTEPGEYDMISNDFEKEAFTQQVKSGGIIPALGSLNMLRMPASLTIIEEEAFEGLDCQAVIIPDSCTTIGSRAFADCTSLVYIYIPASVTIVTLDAFEDCPNVIIDRIQ